MRLILIRHGQTPANVTGALDTDRPGPGLTDLGLMQASAVPDALDGAPIGALYASTLVRTQLTAEPLSDARRLQVEVRQGLHEIEAGALEKLHDPHSIRRYMETVFAWGSGDRDASIPGGPNGHEFFGRFNADLESITGSGADAAAVVSHGAAIRVWVAAYANNVAPMFAAENHLDNTGIVVLDGSFTDGWALTRWADQPIGGTGLEDGSAEDPTGDPVSEAS